jgi:hypothetical protein
VRSVKQEAHTPGQPAQKVSPICKITRVKRAGGMAEYLPECEPQYHPQKRKYITKQICHTKNTSCLCFPREKHFPTRYEISFCVNNIIVLLVLISPLIATVRECPKKCFKLK